MPRRVQRNMKKIGKALKSKICEKLTLFGETKRKRTLNQKNESPTSNKEKRDKPSLKSENIEKMTMAKKTARKPTLNERQTKKDLTQKKIR